MTIKDEQSRVLHSTMYKGLVHCAIVPDFGEVNFWALMASPLRDEEKSTSNEYWSRTQKYMFLNNVWSKKSMMSSFSSNYIWYFSVSKRVLIFSTFAAHNQ